MSRAAMLKTLKGQVLNELGEIQTEALKRAPKDTVAPKETDAKVDVEGKRFENRMAQDRSEGGFGFIQTANSIGDNHFAREQTEALKRKDRVARETEAQQLDAFEAQKAAAASAALEQTRAEDTKSAKGIAWGALSLKAKRPAAGAAAQTEQGGEDAAEQGKRRKTEPDPDPKPGAAKAAAAPPALAGLGDYGSDSDSGSDSDD